MEGVLNLESGGVSAKTADTPLGTGLIAALEALRHPKPSYPLCLHLSPITP
jgi:hypothetical protein